MSVVTRVDATDATVEGVVAALRAARPADSFPGDRHDERLRARDVRFHDRDHRGHVDMRL